MDTLIQDTVPSFFSAVVNENQLSYGEQRRSGKGGLELTASIRVPCHLLGRIERYLV